MQEIARRIAKVSKESKLTIDEDEYVKSFKVELMDAVVQWCRGASFSEICKVRAGVIKSAIGTKAIFVLAHGPVRRQSNPSVQTAWRTSPPDGSSSKGDRQLRAQRKV